MSLASRLLSQCAKPTGWLGRLNLKRMNRHHAGLTEWGLAHHSVGSRDTVLDVGCGGGTTVARLARLAHDGRVYGLDYSEDSVAASRRENRLAIRAGRVEIVHGSVSRMPFSDEMFDAVTAVETHYFWPDLAADMREVRRVLKPGGALVLIAEAYKGGAHDRMLQALTALQEQGIMTFAHLTVDEHRQLFNDAGYCDVQAFEEYERGWLCVTGRRPPGQALGGGDPVTTTGGRR